MKFHKYFLLILALFSTITSDLSAETIADKSLTKNCIYEIMLNGIKAGTCKEESVIINNQFVTRIEMIMQIESVKNIISEEYIESADFKPLKITQNNTVIQNGKKTTQQITITINNQNITYNDGYSTRNITIDEDFCISGVGLDRYILKEKFIPKKVIKTNVYMPELDPNQPLPCYETIIGEEDIIISGKKMKLWHTTSKIGPMEDSDNYYDASGILYKSVINFMSIKMELIKKDEK